MTRLEESMLEMGKPGEWSLGGRWLKLKGEFCSVYVVESSWGARFYTWCDSLTARTVQSYSDPGEAIRAGLERAARPLPGTERKADA